MFSLVRRPDQEPLDVEFDGAALFENGFDAAAGTLAGQQRTGAFARPDWPAIRQRLSEFGERAGER